MTIHQAPCGKVRQRLLGAVTALALGLWMFPSLAATGTDARSDPSMDSNPMSLSAGRELPIQVIDEGATSAVEPQSLPLDGPVAETPVNAAETLLDAAESPRGPQFDPMLRRIFDEGQAHQRQLQQAQKKDDFNGRLAVDKSETVNEPPVVLETDPAEATAGFPGFGADDLLRYRQQMYRTDI